MRLTMDKVSHYLMATILVKRHEADLVIMVLMYGHPNEGVISYRYFRSGGCKSNMNT